MSKEIKKRIKVLKLRIKAREELVELYLLWKIRELEAEGRDKDVCIEECSQRIKELEASIAYETWSAQWT